MNIFAVDKNYKAYIFNMRLSSNAGKKTMKIMNFNLGQTDSELNIRFMYDLV